MCLAQRLSSLKLDSLSWDQILDEVIRVSLRVQKPKKKKTQKKKQNNNP